MIVRTWAAPELLELAQRLPERPPLLAFGLALLAASADVEAFVPQAAAIEAAAARLAAGTHALPESWIPSREWPLEFAALVDRLRVVVGAASANEDDFVFAQATRAFLRSAAIRLAPLVDEAAWRRGGCPICGSRPDLASITAEGERRLLCAWCDAEWAYSRIGCPFCDTKSHENLGYHPAGDGTYRLYVCSACSHYLKVVDLRQRPDACPPLERLLSVGLDVAATTAGYTAFRTTYSPLKATRPASD